ncbi:MAG TPA: hypothetical protein VGK83_05150, partial [Acidimicrobiia bacterium]
TVGLPPASRSITVMAASRFGAYSHIPNLLGLVGVLLDSAQPEFLRSLVRTHLAIVEPDVRLAVPEVVVVVAVVLAYEVLDQRPQLSELVGLLYQPIRSELDGPLHGRSPWVGDQPPKVSGQALDRRDFHGFDFCWFTH